MGRVDLAPEGAGQADLVDRLDAQLVHEQAHTRIQGGLAELDGANVVLGDRDARAAVRAVAQDVAEGAAVGHDPGGTRGERPIDDAVLGDDAREI